MYLKYFLFSLLKFFFLESDLIFLKACVLYFNFFFYICRSFGTNLITPQCTLSLLYTTTYEWIHPFVFIYFLYLSLSLYIYLFILIFIHQYLFFYTNFIEVLDVCCIVSAMTAQFPSRINKVSDSDSCLFLFYILFCFKFVHFFYCLFKLLLNSLFYFIIVYSSKVWVFLFRQTGPAGSLNSSVRIFLLHLSALTLDLRVPAVAVPCPFKSLVLLQEVWGVFPADLNNRRTGVSLSSPTCLCFFRAP